MSDNSVEKGFLYLLGLSVLLHLAVYQVISLIPPPAPPLEQQATMVDLAELPELPKLPQPRIKEPQPEPQPPKNEPRPEIPREVPVITRVAPHPPAIPKMSRGERVPPLQTPSQEAVPSQQAPPGAEPSRIPQEPRQPVARGEGLFKRKSAPTVDSARLFPSAGKLARLEESYRRKYDRKAGNGETAFLNTDDIRLGSFMRRFETAVYGVWRYPEEAAIRGIQGTTPVLITFNRNGEITNMQLLESSGSRILDDEVFRTLRQIGPLGPFAKDYPDDHLNAVIFFHYGNGGGWLR